MNFVDLILIILLVVLVGLVIYFSFIKNKKNPCRNCPYFKSCNKSKCSSEMDNKVK